MENSSRSYDEILAFITSEDAPKDEEKYAANVMDTGLVSLSPAI